MSTHRLRHPFPAVDNNGLLTYGGSQMLSDSRLIRKCGCGLVGAADLFLYLQRCHSGCTSPLLEGFGANRPIPLADYNRFLSTLCRRFLPITSPFGINGLGLVAGINLFFRKYGYAFRARWGVRYAMLWQNIAFMLDRDLPVLIAVGPNLPKFWQDYQLGLFTRLPDGSFRKIGTVKAHYMSVTAMDEEWLTVSSWGHKYYIRRRDYDCYVRTHSNGLVCNIVYIQPLR